MNQLTMQKKPLCNARTTLYVQSHFYFVNGVELYLFSTAEL